MRNTWSEHIKLWGQQAIDDKSLRLDITDNREKYFAPVFESLHAKENTEVVKVDILSDAEEPTLVLVPLSGGMDSIVAYQRAMDFGYEVKPFYVWLNTPYAQYELNVLRDLDIDVSILDHREWPERWEPYKTRWQHILPLRNLFIIMAIAEEVADRPGEIWLGATHGEIPVKSGDKSLKFFGQTDVLLDTLPVKHSLEFPLRSETKSDLVAAWLLEGKDSKILLKTLTCQNPTVAWLEDERKSRPLGCGECHACFNRWVALENNALKEPLVKDPRKVKANEEKVQKFREALAIKDFDTWSQRRIEQTLNAWDGVKT